MDRVLGQQGTVKLIWFPSLVPESENANCRLRRPAVAEDHVVVSAHPATLKGRLIRSRRNMPSNAAALT